MFFERGLVHVKGEWAGRPFLLQPWQANDIIKPLFGWKRVADGLRKYRTVYCEIPKKNGKSSLAAGVALFLLFADDEPGAEIYSAAADRDQAGIVFRLAKQMVEASPVLRDIAIIRRNFIRPKGKGSIYKVVSADAFRAHGPNLHGIIFDELHTQRRRDLWDTLTAGVASRRQPVTFAITTAGDNEESICWEQHEYSRQVKEGVIDDPEHLSIIYSAKKKDNWKNEKVWAKCNPGYGDQVKVDYLRSAARKAEASPEYENTFRRLHLNQWTKQSVRWLKMSDWKQCQKKYNITKFYGQTVIAALDLSIKRDLTALVLAMIDDEKAWLWPIIYIPADDIKEHERQDRAPYRKWVKQGYLKAIPGRVIDQRVIRQEVKDLAEHMTIKEIPYDPYNADQLTMTLGEEDGFTMVEFRQGTLTMSPACKSFLTKIKICSILHPGNPVLNWMADNISVRTDAKGNILPDKRRSGGKIDGIVASIMAADVLEKVMGKKKKKSVYARRKKGILTI